MSASFYTTKKYAELYAGSNSFDAKITATPTAFGLTAPQAAAYAALNATFAAAYLVAADPQTRTKGTIIARNEAAFLLRRKAAELAAIIQATATVTNEQRADLGLNVRKVPGPKGAPGEPTDFTVGLNGDGSLELAFKCANPPGTAGTLYQVYRRTTAAGAFDFIGTSGMRKFVDYTLPAGSSQITYKIQGVRSTMAGPWGTFNVTIGVGGSTATVTAVAAAGSKQAA